MCEETTASQSGFLVSKRTRTMSNLLSSGPESVVLTDKASFVKNIANKMRWTANRLRRLMETLACKKMKGKRKKEIGHQKQRYAAQDHNAPWDLLLQRQLSLY